MKASIISSIVLTTISIAVVAYNMKSEQTSSRMFLSQDLAAKSLFSAWKMQYGKSYGSDAEHTYRANIFAANLKKVNEHNNKTGITYKLAINKFADLDVTEFKAQYVGGFKLNLKKSANVMTFATENLQASINWVTKGAVGAVKDQGQCGSCWAFSAVSSTESANYLQKKMSSVPSYSEQQLVDCAGGSFGNYGCGGGLMDYAFTYIKQNPLETESDYPYTAQDGSCRYKKSKGVGTVSAFTDVTPNSPDQLKAALNNQTVSVAIEADTSVFQFYTSGVITSSGCGQQLDHGVTAVGYGTEGSTDYFLVRNSWGASWGDHGYVKIGASSSNVCGILSQPSYPTA